jgi:ATP-dependent RNA helicase DDX60
MVVFSQFFDKDSRKAITVVKQRSAIPVILRDMAPSEGSRRRATLAEIKEEATAAAEKKKSGGKKGGEKKKATADTIKESNAAEKLKKDHDRDL